MEENVLINLGLLIKRARQAKNISQEELAWQCNITKNGLGKIELGRSNVKITTLVKLLTVLNIKFQEIQNIIKI